jgi:hypothetical protein
MFPAIFATIFGSTSCETARRVTLNVFCGRMFQCQLCFRLSIPLASFLSVTALRSANLKPTVGVSAAFLQLGE